RKRRVTGDAERPMIPRGVGPRRPERRAAIEIGGGRLRTPTERAFSVGAASGSTERAAGHQRRQIRAKARDQPHEVEDMRSAERVQANKWTADTTRSSQRSPRANH